MPRNEWPWQEWQVNVSGVSRKKHSYGNVANCLAGGAEVMQSQAGYLRINLLRAVMHAVVQLRRSPRGR